MHIDTHVHIYTHTHTYTHVHTHSLLSPFCTQFHNIDSHLFRVWAADSGWTAPYLLLYKQRTGWEAGKICPVLF